MAENFNIEIRTTAGYSPWSNGLLERHNQTLTEIILKVKWENGCDWHTALDRALMAKNSMVNVHGYSPHQLVFEMEGSFLLSVGNLRELDVVCSTRAGETPLAMLN